MARSENIGWILDHWASWKLVRPMRDEFRHEEKVRVPQIPQSKPPGLVWMTPEYEVIDYRKIDAAYEALPVKPVRTRSKVMLKEGDEHMLLRLYYLWELRPLTKAEVQRAMGMRHHSEFDRLQKRAFKLIGERI